MNEQVEQMKRKTAVYHGVGIGCRCVCGTLRFLHRTDRAASQTVSVSSPSEELRRLHAALKQVREHVLELRQRLEGMLGGGESEIFEVHGMLLEDEDFVQEMEAEIANGACAENAVETARKRYAELLGDLEDPYLAERSDDISDIAGQILTCLQGKTERKEPEPTQPYILVADDLSPSETVGMNRENLLGFVTFGGTGHSHTAILARAMGIPALVGVGEIPQSYNGCIGLLDADCGSLTVSPNAEQQRLFQKRVEDAERLAHEEEQALREWIHRPAVTKSGRRILIYANIGNETELSEAIANGADGIGLLRSEFLYFSFEREPTEDTLTECYIRMIRQMNGQRVVIRTLDVGADKQIPYLNLPDEENPALGFRGIRVCLAREQLFKTQLRAVLRASAYGKVALMLPMVVSVEEVRRSRRILEDCKQELKRDGMAFDPNPEFGIMIETPAAAIMSVELSETVDFFSVGTNDLLQYTLAADRQNPMVESLCNENRDPVLRLIASSAEAIHHRGGWIGVCGELAAETELTQRWMEMGIDELSVSPPQLLTIKKQVTECR